MKLVAIAIVVTLTATALPIGSARAQEGAPLPPVASCDAAAVEADHLALARERRSAKIWNTAWMISYAVFAGAQVGLAQLEFSPGREFDHAQETSLYIGAGKAVLGSLSRLVLPLRVPQVARSGDPCVDQAALDRAHAYTARKEKRTFWLQVGAGLALHVAGGTYLVVKEDSWRDAITSLALGVVVSGLTLYTEPKTSWRHPRRSVSVVAMPTPDGAAFAVVGAF